jgi:hypothetical protein
MTRSGVTRRRASAGAFALAMVLGLGLGACAQTNTPDEYNTLTRQNFLETCTNYYFENTDDTLAITTDTVKADVTAPNQSQCECAYAVYAGPNNDGNGAMPINSTVAKEAQWANYDGPNFTDLNAQLKTDPTKAWDSIPQDIKDKVNACISGSGTSGSTTSTTAGGDTTTTTAADAATSTTGA